MKNSNLRGGRERTEDVENVEYHTTIKQREKKICSRAPVFARWNPKNRKKNKSTYPTVPVAPENSTVNNNNTTVTKNRRIRATLLARKKSGAWRSNREGIVSKRVQVSSPREICCFAHLPHIAEKHTKTQKKEKEGKKSQGNNFQRWRFKNGQ